MELIERYVTAIGKHLPVRNRADILSEIRSTLQDMIDDRSQKTGRPVDEALAGEVLKEYGAPEKVAATYLPERYLIGPRLYPIFILVVKIVAIVLTALALVGLGFALNGAAFNLEELARTVGKELLQYIQAIIIALGNIVLVFAILERVLPASQIESVNVSDEPWDPADLLKEPDEDSFRLWEPILAIVATFAGIVIFNFYPQLLSFTPSLNNLGKGPVVILPLVSQAFFTYLPWINLLWLLVIGLNLYLIRLGKWNLPARLISFGVKGFGMVIAFAMLKGPSLVGITVESLAEAGISAGDILVSMVNFGVRLALIIAIVVSGLEIIGGLYRLIARRWGLTPPIVRVKK